jgi:hypothetical protein
VCKYIPRKTGHGRTESGESAVDFCQKTDVLRSISGGFRMSERLRNEMEQGERRRIPPHRNTIKAVQKMMACGWLGMERSGMADHPQ